MRTEDLIGGLAARPPRPAGRNLEGRLGAALLAAGAGAALLSAFLYGLRPDLLASAAGAAGLVKFVCGAALGLAGWRLACRLSRPGIPSFCPVAAALAGLAALVAFAGIGLAGPASSSLPPVEMLLQCALPILALSAPILVLALAALRAGAPTRPALAGAAAGLAAGAAGALAYAPTCPAQDALFVVLAYGGALAAASAIGALAGPRALRW